MAKAETVRGKKTDFRGRCEGIERRVGAVRKVYFFHGSQIIVLPSVVATDRIYIG